MTRLASWLIAFLLTALIAAVGMLDSTVGLLMLSPFAALLVVLLIGLYPGESVIEVLNGLIHRPGRSTRDSWLPVVAVMAELPVSVLVPGTLGSRAPPFGI